MTPLVNVCLRASGAQETLAPGLSMSKARKLMGADFFDVVNLHDGRIMLVDDLGLEKDLPINAAATSLYHSVCVPGTTWPIRGDVIIVLDANYEDEE